MMGRPPQPGPDLRTWAQRLVQFLNEEGQRRPQVIDLPYLTAKSRPAKDGQLMYDPVAQQAVISVGGEWKKVSFDV